MRFLSFQSFLLATSLLVSPVVFASAADEQKAPSVPTKKWEDFLENYAVGEPGNLAGIVLGMEKDDQERALGALSVVLQDRLDHNRRDPERIQSILHFVRIDPEWAAANSASRFDHLMSGPAASVASPPKFEPISQESSIAGTPLAAPEFLEDDEEIVQHLSTLDPALRQKFENIGVEFTPEAIRNFGIKVWPKSAWDSLEEYSSERLEVLLGRVHVLESELRLPLAQWARMTSVQIQAAKGLVEWGVYFYLNLDDADDFAKASTFLENGGWADEAERSTYLGVFTDTYCSDKGDEEGFEVRKRFEGAGFAFTPQNIRSLATKADIELENFSVDSLSAFFHRLIGSIQYTELPRDQWIGMTAKQVHAAFHVGMWTQWDYFDLGAEEGKFKARELLERGDWKDDRGAITTYLGELQAKYPFRKARDIPRAFEDAGVDFSPQTINYLTRTFQWRNISRNDYDPVNLKNLLDQVTQCAEEVNIPVARWVKLTPAQINAARDVMAWAHFRYLNLDEEGGQREAKQILVEGDWSEGEIENYLEKITPKYRKGAAEAAPEAPQAPAAFKTAGCWLSPKNVRAMAAHVEMELMDYSDAFLMDLLDEVKWKQDEEGEQAQSGNDSDEDDLA